MIRLKVFLKNRFNVFFIFSSLLVFLYLLFRAIYSSLVCDELTTFFHYIQPESFFYVGNGGDANNHLLNTLLSHISHSLFGFSSLSLRIFSLLSILIYFIYTYKFSQFIKDGISKYFFTFVMLFSLNFLNFFGLSRGYGYSFAFLIGALYHFYIFTKDNSTFRLKNLIYYTFLIALALYANLALLLTTLTLSFLLLLLFIHKKKLFFQLKIKQKIILGLFSLAYVGMLITMISFSFILKENGALYYGQSTDFWYHVVITQLYLLTENKSLFVQSILILFLVIFFATSIISHRNIKFKELYKSNIFFFVLVLNIIGIELLALILEVNYPSDRVAIHIYMLLILALFFIEIKEKQHLKSLKFIAILLVTAVPVYNLIKIDYRNNTVWPLDYFPTSYYTKIIENKTDAQFYPTVSGNSFRGLNYVKHVYQNNGKGNLIIPWKIDDNSLLDNKNHPGKYSDYIISKQKDISSIIDLYNKVDSNTINDINLWERKEKLKYKDLKTSSFETSLNTSNEYFDCGEILIDSLNSCYLLVDIEFELLAKNLPFNGSLIINTNDEDTKENLNYENYPIRFLKSFKEGNKFRQRLILSNLHPHNKLKISAYIWNLKKETYTITNGNIVFHKFIK